MCLFLFSLAHSARPEPVLTYDFPRTLTLYESVDPLNVRMKPSVGFLHYSSITLCIPTMKGKRGREKEKYGAGHGICRQYGVCSAGRLYSSVYYQGTVEFKTSHHSNKLNKPSSLQLITNLLT